MFFQNIRWDRLHERISTILASELLRMCCHCLAGRRQPGDAEMHSLLDEVEAEIPGSSVERGSKQELFGQPALICWYRNGDWSPAAYESVTASYEGTNSIQCGWYHLASDPFPRRRIAVRDDVISAPRNPIVRISTCLGL